MVHGRLGPQCATDNKYLQVFIVEQTLVGIDGAWFGCYAIISLLRNTHDAQ